MMSEMKAPNHASCMLFELASSRCLLNYSNEQTSRDLSLHDLFLCPLPLKQNSIARMCFHFSLTQKMSVIESALRVQWEGAEWQPVYHASGFSFLHMPVITQEAPERLQMMPWGLIPSWVKSKEQAAEIRMQTLNARSETIFEKPSFKTSIQKQRCLIPADGFFEWMEHKGKKYPHYIQLSSSELFCFGGIYASWLDVRSGELLESFSIVTTEANALMAKIHHTKKRMPLILAAQDRKRWLDRETDHDTLIDLMKPFPDNDLKATTICKRITDRHQDSNVPEVLTEMKYPELTTNRSEPPSLFDGC
jgi:putative SOS response-associated peptidase YedK